MTAFYTLIICLMSQATRGYKIINSTASTMLEAESQCETKWSTTLATILTSQDLSTVQSQLNIDDNSIWIGYTGTNNDTTQWVSGVECVNDCVTIKEIEEALNIATPDDVNTCNSTHSIICDGTKFFGGYELKNCAFTAGNCYKYAPSFQLSAIESVRSDIVFDVDMFSPSFAIWNYTGYLIGKHKIHTGDLYTCFNRNQSENGQQCMQNYTYNNNPNTITIPVHSYQYDSLLFIYSAYMEVETIKYNLIGVNLQNMEMLSYSLPFETSEHIQFCIVADANNVFLVGGGNMYIYNYQLIEKFEFEPIGKIRILTDDISTCVINLNETYIYVFGSNSHILYKYNIYNKSIHMVDEPNVCFHATGRGITLPNDKAYLQGCSVGRWNTIIFDMKIEKFGNMKHTITASKQEWNSYIPYYASGALAQLEDTILMMIHMVPSEVNPRFRFYMSFTEYIVFNVQETHYTTFWPSDGITIKYFVISFFPLETNITYFVNIYSVDATNIINETVILFSSYSSNNCTYRELSFFAGHFYDNCEATVLLNLTLMDNNINTLTFDILAESVNVPPGLFNVDAEHAQLALSQKNITTPLFVPNTFTIKLTRCNISFETVESLPVSNNDNPFINMSYELTENCFARIGTKFIIDLSLNSSVLDIKKELLITIEKTTTHSCNICDSINKNDCSQCIDSQINIKHPIISSDDKLTVTFASQSIDLNVYPESGLRIPYEWYEQKAVLSSEQKALIIISSIIGTILIVAIIGYICKRNKQLAAEVKRQTQHTHYIKNPLVLFVGIGFYDDNAKNPGANIYCNDLNGVDRDYENVKKFCELFNYDMYPKPQHAKYDWTEEEIKEFLNEKILYAEANINTLEKDVQNPKKSVNGYDGLVCIFSGHGYKNNIVTNDYQLTNKTALHRLSSTNHPQLRTIPRIFVFDCCDGDQERSYENANPDYGKNFGVGDIPIEQDDDEIWKRDQVNPDYKLILISAANEGFQAKMNSIDGSYLIYELMKASILNIEAKTDLFFGEIVDKVQEDLHSSGKQQITKTYNNHTRYLKFVSNQKMNEQLETSLLNESDKNTQIVYELMDVNTIEMNQVTTNNEDI
eukprot:75746_1